MIVSRVEAIALSEIPSWLNPQISFLNFLDMTVPDLTLPLPRCLEIEIDFVKPIEYFQAFIEDSKVYIKSKQVKIRRPLIQFEVKTSSRVVAIGSVFTVEGKLTNGVKSMYAIDGIDFFVSDQTWLFGNLQIGCKVKASGKVIGTGEWYARKVTVVNS